MYFIQLIDTIGSMDVELTQGKTAIIDNEDAERVMAHSWCFDASNGYPVSRINGTRVRLHRFIMEGCTSKYIDHINRNKLDNRKINLRPCTASQNVRNRGLNKNNTSGYKGVIRFKDGWRAQISLRYKFYDLGIYATAEEAARVYNQKALEFYGEMIYLNKI